MSKATVKGTTTKWGLQRTAVNLNSTWYPVCTDFNHLFFSHFFNLTEIIPKNAPRKQKQKPQVFTIYNIRNIFINCSKHKNYKDDQVLELHYDIFFYFFIQ